MHSNSLHARSLARTISRPLILILAGLMVLSAAMLWRNFPAVTGMALVALGATTATAERFCMSNARGLLLVAHFAIYSALYLLFFGASLDAATGGMGISQLAACDLAASMPIVGAAAWVVAEACRDPRPTES